MTDAVLSAPAAARFAVQPLQVANRILLWVAFLVLSVACVYPLVCCS